MKYFRSLVATVNGEILSFVAHESSEHYLYDRKGNVEWHGVSSVDTSDILSIQHPECEVEEVLFVDIDDILKGSRLYKEINAQVEQRIREKYSIGDEFSILKLEKTDPEYIAYQQFIDECRENGRIQKITLGLKKDV
jgi:hypothetical protein